MLGIKKDFIIIAGPCAVESEEQMIKTIEPIADKIDILRGGAYKPRTSPKSFQGLGKQGLLILKEMKNRFNIPVVTEVVDTRNVELVAEYADMLQVGARNMQNYELLKEVGKSKKPVLLKRGLSATINEWLSSVEYIVDQGNNKIALCERGIRTFETATRFTLDMAGALVAKKRTGLPVIVDPSHATGKPELIKPLFKAIKAAEFDGVMIEVHFSPADSQSDAEQALTPNEFLEIL